MASQGTKAIRFNKVIIIPTDFSPVAENALMHGLELARLLHYRVCLLHVFILPADTIYNKEDDVYDHILQKLLKSKEIGEKKYQVNIDPMIREGNLFKVIHAVVAEIKPRLMIMGTHGKQGLQHLFGSYALKVALDSPCPVLVVQGRAFEHGYRRIVLPVNGDVDPRYLMEWALLLCKLFAPEIQLFQSMETTTDRTNQVKGITSQITGVFQEKKISYSINMSASPHDFSNQVIAFADANQSDLVMTMTTPAADATGFNFSDWNERLMFNPSRIPVMFIDRTDTAG
jgi:nucleotide-binding universal stress UspA family protein